MLNALTIDLEDWAQAVLDPSLEVTDRVVVNVARLLDFLDSRSVRATFFALGLVCEKFPQILPAVAEAGHEIASHGYAHLRVDRLTPEQFAQDLQRSIQIIEAQTGRVPLGYRAPQFSITRRCLWAGPILAAHGFRYSSSIFPIRGHRYGIGDWPRFPQRWPDCNLMEFPITTLRLGPCNLPALGGGYTRLLPMPILAHAIRSANQQYQPAVLYLHPYEPAADEIDSFRGDGFDVPWLRRFTQSFGRSRIASKLVRLLEEFRFAPMREVLATPPTIRVPALERLAPAASTFPAALSA